MLPKWTFTKTFDKAPYGRLTQQIKMHGNHGGLVVWIQNNIIHGRQKIVVEGNYCDCRSCRDQCSWAQ